MKIVLVPNPNVAFSQGQTVGNRYVPLGLLSVATVLKHAGFDVRIVDINRDSLCLDARRSAEGISGEDPDIIGFSTRVDEYPRTLQIAEECKRKRPDSLILFGGPQASATDVATLTAFPFVDLIVRGECEEAIIPLITAIANRRILKDVPGISFLDGGKIVRTPDTHPVTDLDELPVPDYHLVPQAQEFDTMPIEVGRGCPYGCTFCSTKDFFQRRFRFYDTDRLLRLLSAIHDEFGIHRFTFQHDNATVSKKKMLELCSGINKLTFDISWSCSARADLLDGKLVERMAEAGCKDVFIGIETGSPRIQSLIGKKLDVEKVIPVAELLRQHGIEFTASFMMGFPEETFEDLAMTLRLMTEVRFKGNCKEKVQLHMVSAYPGTKLYEQTKAGLCFDGYYSDAAVSLLTKDMRNLITDHPEIFASFQYIDNGILDRKFLLKVNFFFQTFMYYFPYSSLSMMQLPGLDYPRGVMEFLSRSKYAGETWLLSSEETRTATGFQLLNDYFDTLGDEKWVLQEVLTYEKTAGDLRYAVVKDESPVIREFACDVEGWISKVVDGEIPPISDLMNRKENSVVFFREDGKVKTVVLPEEIAEYCKSNR